MNIYKVMVKILLTNNQYADSYWQNKENAEAYVEDMKFADAQNEDEDNGVWHYWVAKVTTKD